MKKFCQKYGSIFIFIFLFPYSCSVLLNGINPIEKEKEEIGEYKVQVEHNTGIEIVPLEEYLVDVMATVIPISYETETLKAQAIILRTDILKKYLEQGNADKLIYAKELPYSYLEIPAQKNLWKDEWEDNRKKLKKAVEATRGLVLTYQGIPMEVPFFAVSVGKTRSGEEVLGSKNYPYLTSVDCREDILAKNYQTKMLFTEEELQKQLKMESIVMEDIQITKTDNQGYVLEIVIMGNSMKGEDFRKQLGLNSSNFTIEIINKKICITTNGIGHGLGFSQYGANKMALEGKTFIEILPYFYIGVQIQKQ